MDNIDSDGEILPDKQLKIWPYFLYIALESKYRLTWT